jgi:hypothetical protein
MISAGVIAQQPHSIFESLQRGVEIGDVFPETFDLLIGFVHPGRSYAAMAQAHFAGLIFCELAPQLRPLPGAPLYEFFQCRHQGKRCVQATALSVGVAG